MRAGLVSDVARKRADEFVFLPDEMGN